MTAIAAKRKLPSTPGKRRSAVDVAERVAFVRELVTTLGRDRVKVHQAFTQRYGETPARTVDEYLARVDRAWLRDAEAQEPDARTAFLAKLAADEKLYAKHKAWSAHHAVRKLEARVKGLDAQAVTLSGSVHVTAGRAPSPDEPLSPELVRLAAEGLEQERGRLGLPGAAVDGDEPAGSEKIDDVRTP